MAIYHLSTKPISRSSGRTATASIAYRAGIAIKDERTGKEHDYTKRDGVLSTRLHTPNNLEIKRNELWNLAETTETRKNSRTAREIVVSLPYELLARERKALVNDFAQDLANKYGVAVDVAIHLPDVEGDNRNHHAHIMLTTRKLERLESGKIALTSKSQLEMSNTQLKERGLPSARDELKLIRKQWADMTNERLENAQIDARIDHRSHKDRGLKQLPTQKLGWEASAMERKGIATDKGDYNRMVREYNQSLLQIAAIDKRLKYEQAQREQSNDRLREKIDRAVKLTGNAVHNTTWTDTRARQVNEVVNDNQQGIKGSERAIDASTGAINQADRAIAEHQRQLEIKQSEVTAVTEPPPNVFAENRQIFLEYGKKVETTAQAILSSQLKILQNKAKPAIAKCEQLRDSEPVYIGKDKWQEDNKKALKAYDAIKTRHNSIKDKGVTNEHREQAKARIAEHEPLYHAKVQQALEILQELERAKQDNIAKQHGADFHAQQYQIYSGKILQVDRNGIVQQTRDGTVFHPDISSVEQGKSYNIERKGDIYETQQMYEFKKSTKSLDQDKGMTR